MRMKTIYLAVGVVVIVGVIAVLVMRGESSPTKGVGTPPPGVIDTVETDTKPETIQGSGTFANLFALGRSLECTFQFKDDGGLATEGTSFFDGTQMRVDSMYQSEGETFTSNMISNGQVMYVWSTTAEGSFAMKMPVPQEGVTSNTEPVDQSQGGLNPQSKVLYDCKPWTVDGSVFIPPAEIDFMDMTTLNQMMLGVPVP